MSLAIVGEERGSIASDDDDDDNDDGYEDDFINYTNFHVRHGATE